MLITSSPLGVIIAHCLKSTGSFSLLIASNPFWARLCSSPQAHWRLAFAHHLEPIGACLCSLPQAHWGLAFANRLMITGGSPLLIASSLLGACLCSLPPTHWGLAFAHCLKSIGGLPFARHLKPIGGSPLFIAVVFMYY